MQAIFCVGLAVSQQETLKQSREYQAVRTTVAWWIACRTSVSTPCD